MSHIFVSYSQHDQEIAEKIVTYLQEYKIDIWYVKALSSLGDNWQGLISDAIETARAGILILSVASANSPAVTREYRRILGQNKYLYILKVDDIPIDEIHEPLRSHTYIDLYRDFESGMRQLVQAIRSSQLPEGQSFAESLSDDTGSKVTLELDFNNTDTNQVVDVIKGLLDKGVKNIRLKNG